jgi:hypothetical protein
MLALGLGLVLLTSRAEAAENLVPDASFESPAPSWFCEEGKGDYFAGKEKVAKAADGQQALAIQGWMKAGSRILSPVFDLPGDTFSGTMKARSFGKANGGSVELALFDEKGEGKLASFGSVVIDGKGEWKAVLAKGVKLSAPSKCGRLGLVVTGPQKGMRLEVDQVGLFAGGEAGTVSDNAEFQSFEAEAMADGKGWKTMDHFVCWYREEPSGMKMLSGSEGSAPESLTVRHSLTVRFPGKHRLWVRLFRTSEGNRARYQIAVQQKEKVVATREIDDGDPALGPDLTWVWVPVDAVLSPGDVQVVVTRPSEGASWVARKIDLFLLTNLMDYQPRMADFRPKAYIRFTNLSEKQDPFCVWVFSHRLAGPIFYVSPGMLSAAGLPGSIADTAGTYQAPDLATGDRDRWLATGETSPWALITPCLQPGGNNIKLIATRRTHVEGFVEGRWKGTLEFALGPDRQVIRKIAIDQDGPRLLMTLPHIFTADGKDIMTGYDHVAKAEATLKSIGTPKGKAAKFLDLNAIVAVSPKMDGLALVEREIGVVRGMGFSGTYTPLTDPPEAAEFHARHQIPHFGMWNDIQHLVKDGCLNQPETEKIKASFQEQAAQFAPVLSRVKRIKLADEPSGPPYAHLVACAVCKAKFVEYLKAQKLQPSQLGVASWAEVALIKPEDKAQHPELFYHTGMFRLWTFANLWKTVVGIKKQCLPENIRTYVNYAPPYGDDLTWDHRGNDLFMTQRNGGLEMGWSEDWLAYGASPQQMSTVYAQLRCAGEGKQPLGGYMVGAAGGPLQQRLKYYILVAGGARHINVYNYGPNYASCDSWSGNHSLYPVISEVQHELGVIDEALEGTVRQKTDVAILYNRTAGIWAVRGSTTEQDSHLIQWALAHAGYDSDYIPEEDVESGKLAAYKVLYLNGVQIRRAAAERIADWVQKGGVLFGDAGAGTKDEFDRPLDTLQAIVGAESLDVKIEREVGRPKHDLRDQKPLDQVSTVEGGEAPAVKFNRLCMKEKLYPQEGAVTILKTSADDVAGVMNRKGKGIAVRVAALPGITYLHDAVNRTTYDPETYLPKKYNSKLRDFIAWPARLAKAATVAACNAPIAEITRYDAGGKDALPERSVLFVVDYTAEPRPDFTMTLPRAAHFTRAYTARGAEVKLKPSADGQLEVAFPLDATDAVVLQK